MNRVKIVVTENIEKSVWEYLEKFTYKDLIKNYMSKYKKIKLHDDVVNNISSSMLQAKEYYVAAQTSTIQISPLLIYYGTINLLAGVYSLKTGTIAEIENHGMFLCKDFERMNHISESRMKGQNPKKGALSVFAKKLFDINDITQMGEWSLEELLSCIPDLVNEFQEIHGKEKLHVLPINNEEFEGLKLDTVKKEYVRQFKTAKEFMNSIPGYQSYYVNCANSFHTDVVNLWIKQGAKDKVAIESITGQEYLPIYLCKNGTKVNYNILLYNYMALFILASLCRYCPKVWNPFVLDDSTGERLLLSKYIQYCERAIPNLVLNEIYEEKYTFITDKMKIGESRGCGLNYDEIKRISEEIVMKEMGSVLKI